MRRCCISAVAAPRTCYARAPVSLFTSTADPSPGPTLTADPSPGQVSPLLDALSKNASLVRLDLSTSGISWDGPDALGTPLVETLAKSPSALASLQALILQHESGYVVPLQRLRMGSTDALAALRAVPFFGQGGPQRAEILFMAAVLRKNTDVVNVERSEAAAGEVAARILEAACKGKLRREAWEAQLTQLIVEGATRRGHLLCLIAVETLRDVGPIPRASRTCPMTSPSSHHPR